MFENCAFIEEVSKEGFKEIIQETVYAKKLKLFTLVDNELHQEIIEQERYSYNEASEHYLDYITMQRAYKTIKVFTWEIESGDVVFTCFIGGEIEVVDLNKLYMLCFFCGRYLNWGDLSCDFTKSERIIKILSFKGVHNFNFDLYSRLNARKLYKIKEGLNAKYTLLGFGEILFSDKGELLRLTAGRQGVLKIPDTCKVIKYNFVDLRNTSVLKVGAGVEKCEEYPFFYIIADVRTALILEFNGTSAEIVSKIFLEIFFHTYGGGCNARRTTIKGSPRKLIIK